MSKRNYRKINPSQAKWVANMIFFPIPPDLLPEKFVDRASDAEGWMYIWRMLELYEEPDSYREIAAHLNWSTYSVGRMLKEALVFKEDWKKLIKQSSNKNQTGIKQSNDGMEDDEAEDSNSNQTGIKQFSNETNNDTTSNKLNTLNFELYNLPKIGIPKKMNTSKLTDEVCRLWTIWYGLLTTKKVRTISVASVNTLHKFLNETISVGDETEKLYTFDDIECLISWAMTSTGMGSYEFSRDNGHVSIENFMNRRNHAANMAKARNFIQKLEISKRPKSGDLEGSASDLANRTNPFADLENPFIPDEGDDLPW